MTKKELKQKTTEELQSLQESDKKSALFHTNKVLKGVVNCCMLNGINFEVEFI